jgi:hypothetical protein
MIWANGRFAPSPAILAVRAFPQQPPVHLACRTAAALAMRPVVDRTFTLDGIVVAHRYSTSAASAATSSCA